MFLSYRWSFKRFSFLHSSSSIQKLMGNPLEKAEEIKRLRSVLEQGGSEGWTQAWEKQITPWDFGDCQPSLVELLEKAANTAPSPEWDPPKTGKALIPGCGRGYDALLFAQRGLEAHGVDISESAVKAANEWLSSQENVDKSVASRTLFKAADFFKMDCPNEYDLGYDYTFFCAIPPGMRPSWGEKYASAIKPGGLLITVMFPIDGDRAGGPPFSVDPESYENVLNKNFTKLYQAKPEKVSKGHEMNELIAVWKRNN